MDEKLKKFLRQASPLIAVQFVLAIINIFVIAASGSFVPWSMIPIAALLIPEFAIFANTVFTEEPGEDPNAFESRLKRFLRQTSALFGTQFLLLMINLFVIMMSGGPQPFWAAIPIAGIAIPEFIIFANTFLAENKSSSQIDEDGEDRSDDAADADAADANEFDRDSRRVAKRAAREYKRQAKQTARDIRNGSYMPAATPAVTPAAQTAVPLATDAASAPAKAVFDFDLETDLEQARRYRQQIQSILKSNPNQNSRLAEVSAQVNDWVKIVETMAARITEFRRNTVIQNDLVSVPKAIAKLENQLASEADERVKARLQQSLSTRQNQLATLEKLRSTMRQAEIQLEGTVASLGTIYSQVLTAQSTNQVADYSHLAADVGEQVHQLQDQIEAIEEVKLGQPGSNLS